MPLLLILGDLLKSEFWGAFGLDQNVQGHLRIILTKWFGQIQLEHKNPSIQGILRKPHPF